MNASEMARRIRSNLGFKLVLGLVLTVGVWGLYMLLQRHPVFPVTTMQPGGLDQMIPFAPGTVYLYESIWFLVPIAPWLMLSRTDLLRYTAGLGLISLVAFSVFVLFPTASPRPHAVHDVNALYRALVQVDNELNAFPSLHAAFAIFHAACCQAVFDRADRHRPIRLIIWLWATGIVASTLLTKQHVVIDAVAGTALGLGGYIVFRGLRGAAAAPAQQEESAR
jgi:hypothetical protein